MKLFKKNNLLLQLFAAILLIGLIACEEKEEKEDFERCAYIRDLLNKK